MKKIIISILMLLLISTAVFATDIPQGSGSYDYYNSIPQGTGAYNYYIPQGSGSYNYYPSYPTDTWTYTFYYSSPGYYFEYSNYPYSYYNYYDSCYYYCYTSCYYNCYPPYQPPVYQPPTSGCFGNRNCYYDGSVYQTPQPFTPPNNLIYSGPTEKFVDPRVPPGVATPMCTDPKGEDGDVRIFGVRDKSVFRCSMGAWQLVTHIDTPNFPDTGAPNKRGFYGGTLIVD